MYHTGRIVRKQLASPTVMILDLEVPGLSSFQPGQWVDFSVPPHKWLGGFSIASSPTDLPKLTLAIKKSNHPPSLWVHDDALRVHRQVQVQVGGTCVLTDDGDGNGNGNGNGNGDAPTVVFCAGGIGISPILSQYREYISQRNSSSVGASTGIATTVTSRGPARFLYSVSTQEELVFGDELSELSMAGNTMNSADQMIFSLTQASKWNYLEQYANGKIDFQTGRVMIPFLDEAPAGSIFYLCGPPRMLDEAVAHLTQTKDVPSSNIRYEKWW